MLHDSINYPIMSYFLFATKRPLIRGHHNIAVDVPANNPRLAFCQCMIYTESKMAEEMIVILFSVNGKPDGIMDDNVGIWDSRNFVVVNAKRWFLILTDLCFFNCNKILYIPVCICVQINKHGENEIRAGSIMGNSHLLF